MSNFGPSEGVNSGGGQGSTTASATVDDAKQGSEGRVYIWDGVREAYWRPNGRGYTYRKSEAGKFARAYAQRVLKMAGPEKGLRIENI